MDQETLVQLLIGLTSGLVGAVVGVIFGHILTIRIYKKRADSLELGFYAELELIFSYFQSWLSNIYDEYERPHRDSYKGFPRIDLTCIDSLTTELIAVNRLFTKDQRELILNLKSKFRNMEVKDHQRDENLNHNENGNFYINPAFTARLIIDGIEVIWYLNKFIKSKNNFRIDESDSWENKAKKVFLLSGIDFNSNTWKNISLHIPEDNKK